MEENELKEWHKRLNSPENIEGILPVRAPLGRAVEVVQTWQMPATRSKEQAWELLLGNLEAGKPAGKHVYLFNRAQTWQLAAAASVACLVVAAVYLFFFQTTTVKVGNGQTLAYQLPDGSTVTLNAGSELQFHEKNWPNQRELHLKGEAFFEVEKGSPFTVVTQQGTVTVLGTSFNVYSRQQRFEVACKTGKVKVNSFKPQAEEILLPGDVVKSNGQQIDLSSGNAVTRFGQWRQGEFHFEAVSTASVFEELERQFDVKITATVNQHELFTGYFYNQNLSEALQMVCQPMGYQFEVNGKNVKVLNP